jgi:hypothetical protein
MSIHDFHSKLMSGKEEGTLFEALRSLRSIGGPAIWKSEGSVKPGWGVWQEEETEGRTFLSEGSMGWAVWQDGSFGPPIEA